MKIRAMVVAPLLVCAAGCGTQMNLVDSTDHPGPEDIYGGVKIDGECLWLGVQHWRSFGPVGRVSTIGYIVDLPLSAVADTLTLPITVPATIERVIKNNNGINGLRDQMASQVESAQPLPSTPLVRQLVGRWSYGNPPLDGHGIAPYFDLDLRPNNTCAFSTENPREGSFGGEWSDLSVDTESGYFTFSFCHTLRRQKCRLSEDGKTLFLLSPDGSERRIPKVDFWNGSYRSGRPHGTWTVSNDQGHILTTIDFNEGKAVSWHPKDWRPTYEMPLPGDAPR